jgi:hypothetical protein
MSATVLRNAIALGLTLCAADAIAQSITPQQFIASCQTSPGNVVRIDQDITLQGRFVGDTYVSPSGCSVLLAPDASLKLDQVTLNFGGPFTVNGGSLAQVALDKGVLAAPSIELALRGDNSEVMIKEGRFFATEGDLAINFGRFAKLEMIESGGWTSGGLRARGALRVASDAFFSGTISKSGIEGGHGIFLDLRGDDSVWKIDSSTVNVSSFTFAPADAVSFGPFEVTSAARKALLEISDVNLRFAARTVTISLTGAESSVLMKKLTSQTGSQNVYVGATGEKGLVLIENSSFYGNPEISVLSGSAGATTVIGSPGTLYAQRRVSVATGAGGSCFVDPPSTLQAPEIRNCR